MATQKKATLPELPFNGFLTHDQVTGFAERLAAARPRLCRLSSLGMSREDRPIHLLTITDFETGAAADKPAYLVHGNIHSAELAGTHTALYTARQLVAAREYAELLKNVAFYIVPRLNPDGAERAATRSMPIRSRWEIDMSQPNTLYPEDIDGDGRILFMLKEDEDGDHVFDEDDPRFLRQRRHGAKGPFYKFFIEGHIHNWDGGESIRIGSRTFDWNRMWSCNWAPEPQQKGAGDFPFFEPEMRALAQFVFQRKNLFAMLGYHCGGARLFLPPSSGGFDDLDKPDQRLFKELGSMCTELTGLDAVPQAAHGAERKPSSGVKGQELDFAYYHRGVQGIEIELGIMLESAGIDPREQRTANEKGPAELENLWRRALWWWDQQDSRTRTQNPLFADWRTYNHPQLGPVLLGGFLTSVLQNPSMPDIRKRAEQTFAFTVQHASWAPRVGIEDVRCEQMGGGVFRIRVRVANRGRLATNVTGPGRRLACVAPVSVQVHLDERTRLLSRQGHRELGHLDGVTGSREVEWFVSTVGAESGSVDIHVDGGAGGRSCVSVDVA